MIRFKEFLIEQVSGSKTQESQVEHLPLERGHIGVSSTADMLEGIHKTFLGKSSPIKAIKNYDGLPIKFGLDGKTKQLFVSHGGKINVRKDDAIKNYTDTDTIEHITAALTHLPKIMPKNTKTYEGTIVYSNPNNIPADVPISTAPFALSINRNEKGQPLSMKERLAFKGHPDVFNIDPTIQPNAEKYGVEDQNNFLVQMKEAKHKYAKMKPEAFEAIAGHEGMIKKHINLAHSTGQTPDAKSYQAHLQQDYGDRIDRSESGVVAERRSKKHGEMAEQLSNNFKHFDDVIKTMHHFKQAKEILHSVGGNMTIFNGNESAVIKGRKK